MNCPPQIADIDFHLPQIGQILYVTLHDAVAQLAAGRVVARSDARKAVADVEDAVPILEPDLPVDSELEQLHAAQVA